MTNLSISKEGIYGWYKKEGDKTGMNGCMLPWC